MIHRLNLIGCSKSKSYKFDRKRGGRVKPHELYTGQLFQKQMEHAHREGVAWAVLSARFGVWRPDCQLRPTDDKATEEPYSVTMGDLSKPDRAMWHADVAKSVMNELWEPFESGYHDGPVDPKDFHVEIHAGKDYAEPLRSILELLGVTVTWPLKGLSIGQQLKWYNEQAKGGD